MTRRGQNTSTAATTIASTYAPHPSLHDLWPEEAGVEAGEAEVCFSLRGGERGGC